MSQFVLLCVTVCLATTALLLVVGTILAQVSWISLRRKGLDRRILHCPCLLFLVRTLPLSLPAAVTFLAVLPSFLKLEPRQTAEKPEWWVVGLSLFSVLVGTIFVLRVAMILARTSQVRRALLCRARRLDVSSPIPAYAVATPDSIFAVVGILRPRLFIGQRVLDCLTCEELQAAIAHEIGHVQAFDNLKQVILRAIRVPRLLAASDRALLDAAEIAADRRALRNQISPLDLGEAIIKVARLNASPVLAATAASHLVPELDSSALRVRVEHIQSALEERSQQVRKVLLYPWIAGLALLILYLVKLPLWLALTHRVTELLVR